MMAKLRLAWQKGKTAHSAGGRWRLSMGWGPVVYHPVVGQMLDYAAIAVVNWRMKEIRGRFDAYCEGQGIDPDDQIETFLDGEKGADEFWERANDNLRTGKVRLLFVADKIPIELRRIVEFLNKQMSPAEVLAVEIKQYAGEGLRTLVPRVIGQTIEKQEKKGRTQSDKKWDEETYFQELEGRGGKEAVIPAIQILGWAKINMSRVWWGRGSRSGSFVPVINCNNSNLTKQTL